MKKYFLIILLLWSKVLASELIIDTPDKEFREFELKYYQDINSSLNLNQIQKHKDYKKINNKSSLGHIEGTIWHHFSITNKTNETLKRIIYFEDFSLDELDIYVIENNQIKQIITRGLTRLDSDNTLDKTRPQIEISLLANSSKDIYIKSKTAYPHVISIEILSFKALVEKKLLLNTIFYLYFGALMALILYNLFLYVTLKDTNYLLYILFVFFYGFSHYFQLSLYPLDRLSSIEMTDVFGSSFLFWFAFHTLFSARILNIKEYYPKTCKFIVYNGYFLLILGFIGIFELPFAIFIMNFLLLILPFFILVVAIKIHFQKNKVAIYYIIAQSLFISSNIIFGLLFSGAIEYTYLTRYIHLAGSLAEIILFSLALAYKTRLIMTENQKQKELVDEYSKFSFLGQTIINIYHQWKSPVNNIYNSINHIETAKEFKDKDINKIIDENLYQIRENTQYLKDTALNYLGHYKQIDEPAKKVNLYNEISSVVNLIKLEASKINLKTTIKCEDDISIILKKNHFTNLLMILLENAISEFKMKSIKNPKIEIIVEKKENKIIMQVQDNAGGINIKPIERIFEQNHSQSSSTGIGLFLLKEYLLPKLDGEVDVENYEDGVRFTFIFDIKKG